MSSRGCHSYARMRPPPPTASAMSARRMIHEMTGTELSAAAAGPPSRSAEALFRAEAGLLLPSKCSGVYPCMPSKHSRQWTSQARRSLPNRTGRRLAKISPRKRGLGVLRFQTVSRQASARGRASSSRIFAWRASWASKEQLNQADAEPAAGRHWQAAAARRVREELIEPFATTADSERGTLVEDYSSTLREL